MGGIFGTISKKSCVADLFYGTDYNSHLGTRRGGLATYSSEKGFVRSIHNLESSYFRTKFEPTLNKFEGATSGIGVISDTDAQPLIMNSHLGRFAICTVAKIVNKDELTQYLLDKNMHFAEMSSGSTNPTELVALLIIQGKTFREGIENVFHHIKGSCTMMILTEDGIICACLLYTFSEPTRQAEISYAVFCLKKKKKKKDTKQKTTQPRETMKDKKKDRITKEDTKNR